MPILNSKSVASLILATLSVSTVSASVVYQKDHWYLVDYSTGDPNSTACVMGTSEQKNGVDYRLEFLTFKNSDGPTELQINQIGQGGAKSMTTTIGNGQKLAFATLTDIGNTKTLMNIPQGHARLVRYFEGRGELRMYPADGSRDRGVNFEDAGFTEVKERFEQRCLGGRSLVNASFENSFLRNSHLDIDPAAIDINSTSTLRDLYYQGFRTHKEIGANSDQIGALRAQFGTELREQSQLQSTIADLSNRINANPESQILSLLSSLERAISGQRQAVETATRSRDRAENAIAPLRAEHQRRSSFAQNERTRANNAQQDISNMSREIEQKEAMIEQLRRDIVQAERLLVSSRSRLPRARRDLEQAQRQNTAYNPESDFRQRVHGNAQSRRVNEALPAARVAEDQAEAARDAAHDEKERLEDVSKACRRVRGRDCSAEVAAHRAALEEYRRLEDIEDDVENRRQSLESTKNSIERNARNAVNTIVADLRRDLDNASAVVVDLQNTIRSNENFIARAERTDIPNLRRDIRQLDNQLTRAHSTLRSSAPEADRLERELAQYEQRVGWNAKATALRSAQNNLNQKTSELNRSLDSQRTAQSDLSNVRRYQSQLNQSQARLVEVEASLTPFEIANANLQSQENILLNKLQNLKAQFDNIVE